MAVSLATLTSQVRLESGLRSNQVLTDAQIATFLGEAYSDLRDRLIARFASWFRKEITFTLAGGSDYIFDLTALPDFQMAQGLDLVLRNSQFSTVPMLASYQERNAFCGAWPLMTGSYGYQGGFGRKYMIDGDQLQVLPPQNAQGTYRLVYTPIETMQAATVLPIALQASDSYTNIFGTGRVLLGGFSFDPGMVGGTAVLNFGAPNTAVNGTYTIGATPTGSSFFNVVGPLSGVFWTSPSSGAVTITYNPVGTVSSLPDKLTPWSQYLVLYAALAVRNSRNQPIEGIMARFQDIKQRVIDLTKQRSQGVQQAPISTNRYGGWGRNGYGF
jgi:hypothetical protein